MNILRKHMIWVLFVCSLLTLDFEPFIFSATYHVDAASAPAFTPGDDDNIIIPAPVDNSAEDRKPGEQVPVISEKVVKKNKNPYPSTSKIKPLDEQHAEHAQHTQHTQHTQTHHIPKMNKEEQEELNTSTIESYTTFLNWCRTTLGITTLLAPKQFEYVDHLSESRRQILLDGGEEHISTSSSSSSGSIQDDDIPTIQVRGLAATRDIESGEVVISIPYLALLTVETTIDHDPVLSRILGPSARQQYGWTLEEYKFKSQDEDIAAATTASHTNSNSNEKTLVDAEIPLLIISILYHKSLGPELSPIWRYIDSLLSAPVDSMPFLWDRRKLRRDEGLSPGAKKLARDIQKDVREMYDTVMSVLLTNYPDIFGPPTATTTSRSADDSDKETRNDNENSTQNGGDKHRSVESDKWMFSYEEFQWAFAIVNSRHWFLPLGGNGDAIKDSKISTPTTTHNANKGTKETSSHNKDHDDDVVGDEQEFGESSAHADAPPATQPTDEWVSEHDEGVDPQDGTRSSTNTGEEFDATLLKSSFQQQGQIKHSFMAPLADLINFGPPCTSAQYNAETESFDVIATCSFKKGEEVTYWYSDDCEDIIIANYGFTHPMVTRCLTLEDWMDRSEMWKKYAEEWMAYAQSLEDTIQNNCDCDDQDEEEEEDVNDGDMNMAQIHTPTASTATTTTPTTGPWINDSQDTKKNDYGRVRRTRQRNKEDLGL